jgi:hypothetical protein
LFAFYDVVAFSTVGFLVAVVDSEVLFFAFRKILAATLACVMVLSADVSFDLFF